ncbi:hypothetical protein ACFL35_14155 [Candidatus Riflebacteria bacterium]
MKNLSVLCKNFYKRQKSNLFSIKELEIYLNENDDSLNNYDIFEVLQECSRINMYVMPEDKVLLPWTVQKILDRDYKFLRLDKPFFIFLNFSFILIFFMAFNLGMLIFKESTQCDELKLLQCHFTRLKLQLNLNKGLAEPLKKQLTHRPFHNEIINEKGLPHICPAGGIFFLTEKISNNKPLLQLSCSIHHNVH